MNSQGPITSPRWPKPTHPSFLLGVDPGRNGAWAVVDPMNELVVSVGNLHLLDPKDTKRRGRPRRRLYGNGLIAALEVWAPWIRKAIIEKGQTREANSRRRVFVQGEGVGLLKGIIQARGIPFRMAEPSIWKPSLGLMPHPDYQERKRIARSFAARVFPGVNFARHDHAEAALVALWYARIIMPGDRVREAQEQADLVGYLIEDAWPGGVER